MVAPPFVSVVFLRQFQYTSAFLSCQDFFLDFAIFYDIIKTEMEGKPQMTTGQRIKQARLAAGLTQKELAEKVGVKFSAIHKYESGMIVNLKRETIAALAEALDVKPSWLMCMDEDNTPPEDLDDSPQVRMIARAGKKMSEADREKMLQLIKVAFPDKFDD
ncbi:MAG: helix-turn-helix transcriptional regulator [Mogibacterium sp.]|nr:helix-turn-helix transcriptional regulator [Mogibacterium sp.]